MSFDATYGEGALAEYAAAVSDLPLVAVQETWPLIVFRWDDGAAPDEPQTSVHLEVESPEVWYFRSMNVHEPRAGFLATFCRPAEWAIEHGITTIKARPVAEAAATFRRIGFVDSDEQGTLEVPLTRLAEYWAWKSGQGEEPEWHATLAAQSN